MATAWCHWRILPSGSIVREKCFYCGCGGIRIYEAVDPAVNVHFPFIQGQPIHMQFISADHQHPLFRLQQNLKIIMTNRRTCTVNGVNDVLSFDLREILLETEQGMLMIRGYAYALLCLNLPYFLPSVSHCNLS